MNRKQLLVVLTAALVLTLVPATTGSAFLGSLFKKPVKKVEQTCVQVYEAVEDALGTELDLYSTLYYIQEDLAHGTITELTGIAIPHGYIVVDACGQSIPIDPPFVYN